MAYTKTTWVNDQAPDIDADNLNKIETGIYNAHTSLNTKANQSTLATVESSSSASKAYSVGDYLVYNGILYRVTAAIAKNATLTPNTNIKATNAGAELTSLNSDVTSLNNDLTNLIRSSTATITTNTAGAVVGGPEAFGMPAGAVLLAAYFNRGNYGATRNVTVSMYGTSGYRMDFTDGTSVVTSQSVSLTCYYIKP